MVIPSSAAWVKTDIMRGASTVTCSVADVVKILRSSASFSVCLSIENTSIPVLDVEGALLVSKEDSFEAALLDTAYVEFLLIPVAIT